MIKAVIFDLFETLITEWGHEKYTKRKIIGALGIPAREAVPRRHIFCGQHPVCL